MIESDLIKARNKECSYKEESPMEGEMVLSTKYRLLRKCSADVRYATRTIACLVITMGACHSTEASSHRRQPHLKIQTVSAPAL
eukprot:3769553-Amphidinium_carterae.2